VRELTDGFGVHSVLGCVGLEQSMLTAVSIARPGGAVVRVGVPQDETMPESRPAFYNNVTVSGGPARSARILRSFCPTSSRAESSLAGSSTGSCASTRCPTATGR
jgi:threonine dehydrogenase-like Zn-dependent dehydrogenase